LSVANLAAFLEDQFHQIVAREDPASATPIFGASRACVIRKQRAHLLL
jgi:hypothetical protein